MLAPVLRVAVALLGAASATFAQQGDEATVRVRSLVPFQLPSQQIASPLHSALPGGLPGDAPSRLDAPADPPDVTWVVERLAQRHRGAIDGGRLVLELGRGPGDGEDARNGCSLLLRGRAEDVDACTRDLDAIGAAIGRPIEVTAWRLPLPEGDLPATTWDAPALQQALQRGKPLWTARGRTRSGGGLRLAQERGIGHLRDLDMEVAQDARITDPKVDVAFAGMRATLTVHALPGDDLLLTGSWLLSEPVALREQSVGVGSGSVDLPEHRTAWVSFAGRIGSGGALAVAGRGGEVGPDGFLLVVGARYLAPPSGEPAADLLVRPVGALLAGLPVERPQLGWRVPGDDAPAFGKIARDGGLAGADLLLLLGTRPPADAELCEGILVLSGDADSCRRGDALLRQLFAGLRPVSLHSRVAADGGQVLEVVQPLLADRAGGAFVGRERAVLCDHEVEIAEKAQAPNPVVAVARSGLWFGATVAASGAAWHVAGTWSLAAHDAPRVREHAEKPPMTLQLVDYRATALPWEAPMAAGQEHVLGDGPAWTAGGAPTRVTVRLDAP